MNIIRKIELHNKLYAYADKLIKKHNPCKIKNGKCIQGSFCCHGCKYLTEKGCSVKCLWCKLWLCYYIHQQPEHRLLSSKLRRIGRVAVKHRLIVQRGSEKDLIKQLQCSCKTRNCFE